MQYKPEDLVIYEDQHILVVNKPAGLLALPDGYQPELPHLKGLLQPVYGRLWIVHRLDKEASGVLLLARTAEAHRLLNIQFEHRQVIKTYHTLITGEPEWDEQQVRLPLRVNGDRSHRTVVDESRGKPSVTQLKVLERFGGYSLVQAIPQTGRTHQIRAHLSCLGHPIICDRLYGGGEAVDFSDKSLLTNKHVSPNTQSLSRLGLHALEISLHHPHSHDLQTYHAEYPPDFSSTLQVLRADREPLKLDC